jgi:hypothetical protein
MHNIHPNTKHVIVTIRLAVRCINYAMAADAVNESLRPLLLDDNTLFADYSLDFGDLVTSSGDPQENDLT